MSTFALKTVVPTRSLEDPRVQIEGGWEANEDGDLIIRVPDGYRLLLEGELFSLTGKSESPFNIHLLPLPIERDGKEYIFEVYGSSLNIFRKIPKGERKERVG